MTERERERNKTSGATSLLYSFPHKLNISWHSGGSTGKEKSSLDLSRSRTKVMESVCLACVDQLGQQQCVKWL